VSQRFRQEQKVLSSRVQRCVSGGSGFRWKEVINLNVSTTVPKFKVAYVEMTVFWDVAPCNLVDVY
jgi:hypothetical protein